LDAAATSQQRLTGAGEHQCLNALLLLLLCACVCVSSQGFYLLYNFSTVQSLVDRAHAMHQQPQHWHPPAAAHQGVPSMQQQHAEGTRTRHLLQQHSAMVAALTHGSAGSTSADTSSSSNSTVISSSTTKSTNNNSSSSSGTTTSSSWNGRTGDSSLTTQQRLLRGTFYVFANVMNLVCISSL
jgi:hypothetical protein